MERARLEILDASGAVKAHASCDVGDTVLDACDEMRAGVPFGCRNASCGSCTVEVVAGAASLEPPSRLEASVLLHHSVDATDRLACRAVIAAPGLVRLRARRTEPV
jgi:ferredoxin